MNHNDKAQENAQKSRVLAIALFPLEEWIVKEPNIWIGKSRLRKKPKERAKLAWEIEQIRVFISPDSAVYFLPVFSDLSVGSVKAKVAGELKGRTDQGRFICYFETLGTLLSWSYDESRGIIGTKTV